MTEYLLFGINIYSKIYMEYTFPMDNLLSPFMVNILGY